MTISMPLAAALLGAYPLIAQLFAKHGYAEVRAENFAAFAQAQGHALLLFTEDPFRDQGNARPRGNTARDRPRVPRAFHRRRPAAGGGARAAAALWIPALAALVMLKDGEYVGVVEGLRNWNEYIEDVARLLAAAPVRPPAVGIAVKAAGAAGGVSTHSPTTTREKADAMKEFPMPVRMTGRARSRRTATSSSISRCRGR